MAFRAEQQGDRPVARPRWGARALFGPQYLDLAVALGVPPDRIETIVSIDRARELGTKTDGSANASTPEILVALADLVATGAIEMPIAAIYPLDGVTDAFAELERRHTRARSC